MVQVFRLWWKMGRKCCMARSSCCVCLGVVSRLGLVGLFLLKPHPQGRKAFFPSTFEGVADPIPSQVRSWRRARACVIVEWETWPSFHQGGPWGLPFHLGRLRWPSAQTLHCSEHHWQVCFSSSSVWKETHHLNTSFPRNYTEINN